MALRTVDRSPPESGASACLTPGSQVTLFEGGLDLVLSGSGVRSLEAASAHRQARAVGASLPGQDDREPRTDATDHQSGPDVSVAVAPAPLRICNPRLLSTKLGIVEVHDTCFFGRLNERAASREGCGPFFVDSDR